ncbi:class II fructose-bisphosphate aldolase [Marinilactibacillus psychrotolerans]|uniref:Fructose-bisphosphate aldolase n=1 Tax=Marinilactibacillus psychrotolerans TaxID=191770 RepID=A0AAV3WXB8_9LACT|nr:class II fructose-bisphosphate aldolase [Marinilactibacillus psychrotolerans]GEL67113.1 aldolase [Marinilactibacillus psychrotolerans]GEQ35474.1 fructose-bisphosphate aldolase [Marinilactibacillus psychrotolerans]SDC87364.1 fructose-bisphosphate aldolase, class II [Marinilactibacillus psychrotolerans]
MLVNMKQLVEQSYKEKFGVLAINCFNLETIRATIQAAQEQDSPIIVNMYEEHLKNNISPEIAGKIVKELAEASPVPIALNLDHGKDESIIQRCLDSGFTSIMIDASDYDLEENIEITKKNHENAKKYNACVEAELGHMGDADTYSLENISDYTTKLADVKRFVEETRVDCLAINVGTAHGLYSEKVEPTLDFELLKKINEEASIPLVLHGGSGAGQKNLSEAIKYGITKINVGAAIFAAGREAIERTAEKDLSKVMLLMEQAYKQEIVNYMGWVNSKNKA